MDDPLFAVDITVGGKGQSYKFAAFPAQMHANQSFILQATLKEDGAQFDISSATANLLVSGWKNSISRTTLIGGVFSDSGDFGGGTIDRVTFTVPKDLIPEVLGTLPLRSPGNSVFYFILEDSDSILQFFQQVNVIDTNYNLSGDVDPSSNVIIPDENDLGTVISVGLNTPPGSPVFGDAYIIGTSPTGLWSANANDLTVFNGVDWVFYDTLEGNFVFDINTSQQQIFNGTLWAPTAAIIYSDGESINDNNSNELLTFGVDASAVNNIKTSNAATGDAARIEAIGDDANIDLTLHGKGTGKFTIADGADNTKEASFDVSGITTATKRIVTIPDSNGTILFNIVEDSNPQAGGVFDLNAHLLNVSLGADVASGPVLPLLKDGNHVNVTGTTTITSFQSIGVGSSITLKFNGILTLSHNATDLILPGGSNITTAAGDHFTFTEYASGDYECTAYALASGEAIVGGAGGAGNFPTSTDHADITTAYTVLVGDENTTLPIGSATAATFDITYDVSLWTDQASVLGVVNESAFIVRVVVSNTGTMTLGSGGTDLFVGPGESVYFGGDTSTNARIISRT